MTEFADSIKAVDEKIASLQEEFRETLNNKMMASKSNENSSERKRKENVLAGLKQLQKSNNKGFANVQTDNEQMILVNRARELAKEIEKVKGEIADLSVNLKSFKDNEEFLRSEIERWKKERNLLEKKEELQKRLDKSDSFNTQLYLLEEFFNGEFNYGDLFEDVSFTDSSFVQDNVRVVLAEKFSAAQVNVLMNTAVKSTRNFDRSYSDWDDGFNMAPGIFFEILGAQIEAVSAFEDMAKNV